MALSAGGPVLPAAMGSATQEKYHGTAQERVQAQERSVVGITAGSALAYLASWGRDNQNFKVTASIELKGVERDRDPNPDVSADIGAVAVAGQGASVSEEAPTAIPAA